MSRLWMIRLGRNGEFETRALDEGVLTVGFNIAHDIGHLTTREQLIAEMARLFPDDKPNRHKNFAAQVNQFINVAETGDLVVSPIKTTATIAIGRLSGPYRSGPGGEAIRPVEWLKTDLPRDTFRQDLLYSFGAFMTVCEVRRNDALNRVKAVLETGRDPGDGLRPEGVKPAPADDSANGDEASFEQSVSLDQIARDQIRRRIASTFAGHDFTRLIAAILTAQGYRTRQSPAGPDGGIDITAGSGPLGLESPRIVVQVKSGSYTVEQPDLQSLIGTVQDTQADHGLMVSWGGFKAPVRRRINELYFRVRFWGQEEVIDNLLSVYDGLPEDIRADLPLRRTWTLVIEDEEIS